MEMVRTGELAGERGRERERDRERERERRKDDAEWRDGEAG